MKNKHPNLFIMLLCGWRKRKNKQSMSQDRCDTNVSIEEEKQVLETSIPGNITAKSEDCKDPQNVNQSMLPFYFYYFLKTMLRFILNLAYQIVD